MFLNAKSVGEEAQWLILATTAIVLLAGCGEPEVVTFETLTQEFCEGIANLLDLPKAEREVEFVHSISG